MANDCNGNCESCQASSVHNELTPEARERLTKQFAFLAARYRRVEMMKQRILRRRDNWDYPYE